MRREPSHAERLLWSPLRADQFFGMRFRRQFRIDYSIIDFYCAAARLAIEVDGDSHADRELYDEKRTALLKTHGVRVVRFTNDEVIGNIDGVLESLEYAVTAKQGPSPVPSPRVQGEGAKTPPWLGDGA
jgi:adenine-specific DNA-methyltransferase